MVILGGWVFFMSEATHVHGERESTPYASGPEAMVDVDVTFE